MCTHHSFLLERPRFAFNKVGPAAVLSPLALAHNLLEFEAQPDMALESLLLARNTSTSTTNQAEL